MRAAPSNSSCPANEESSFPCNEALWTGGHRVPFIACWPGHIPAGQTSGDLIAHVDTLATLASLTEQKLPPEAGPDSFNVRSAWLGEKSPTPPRDHLVLQNNGSSPLALRQGEWILIQHAKKPAGPELYHLTKDPRETENLAAGQAARVKEMAARLDALQAQARSRPLE